MNVLLTGGLGYIGSHTAIPLLLAGHNVVVLDNLSNSSVDVLSRIAAITGRDAVFFQGDVRNSDLVRSILRDCSINSVIHFAGLKAVGESVIDPIRYYSNNVQGSVSLLEAMNDCSVRRLVFSSSATVYGAPKYLPFDEEHSTGAINPYGRSKEYVEGILSDVAQSSSEWSFAILRYFNPVGAHESGLLGELPTGIPNNLMPFLAQVAIGRREFLNIFGDDYETLDGTGVRDYLHVMDLAEGHHCALNYIFENSGCHVFNLGTGVGTSVLELVRAFENASGRAVPFRITGRRAGDLPAYYANAEKAYQVLGWRASRSLNEMCASTWKWQKGLL